MRWFLAGIAATLVGGAVVAALIYFLVLPRLDWGADQEPPKIEEELVEPVIDGWVARHAGSETNPLPASPENLKEAHEEFEEHCAACHGIDGSGRNRFGAEFYPPVPKLTGDTQELSDGQLYFIVKKGFASTGMPAFGANHSSEDIWRMVLWVRHLGTLTAAEKSALEKEVDAERKDEMKH